MPITNAKVSVHQCICTLKETFSAGKISGSVSFTPNSSSRAGKVCRASFKRSWVYLSGSDTKPSCVWWTEEALLYRRKTPSHTECVKTEMSSVFTQVCTHLCVRLRASCASVCVCVCANQMLLSCSDPIIRWFCNLIIQQLRLIRQSRTELGKSLYYLMIFV